MKRLAIRIVLAAMLSAGALAAVAADDDALYQALGQRDGIQALTTDFVTRVKADPRIGRFFKDINSLHLANQLRDQFCELAGGPCKLDAPSMKDAHDGLGVSKADFNALVDVLQQSMDERGIPFRAQNQLLARLAPMHREIIGR